jgi:hypothetical protein
MSLTSPDKLDTVINNHVIEPIKIPPTDNISELVFIVLTKLMVIKSVPRISPTYINPKVS